MCMQDNEEGMGNSQVAVASSMYCRGLGACGWSAVTPLFQRGVYMGCLCASTLCHLLALFSLLLEQIAKGLSGPQSISYETHGDDSIFASF